MVESVTHNLFTGLCAVHNGGCSHTCKSENENIVCSCPRGMVLSEDQKTCKSMKWSTIILLN